MEDYSYLNNCVVQCLEPSHSGFMFLSLFVLSEETRRITIMLLTVSFAYLVLTTPFHVKTLVSNTSDFISTLAADPHMYNAVMTFNRVTLMMYTINFAITFYLYIISGSKFRRDVVEMCSCMIKSEVPLEAGLTETEHHMKRNSSQQSLATITAVSTEMNTPQSA